MYKCCIFDLDGTLINTIHAIRHTVNLTLQKYDLGPIDEEHTKQFVGDGYKKLMERALLYCKDEGLSHYEDALATYPEYFKKNCLYQIEPYEGMKELLADLKDRGVKIAVVSNKSHDRAIDNVEMVFGKGYFDRITGEQEGVRCKPDPSGVLKTAEELGMEIRDCLYLGDTNTDMQTGINAHMDTAGVLWGFRGREELEAFHPKYLLEHPSDIKKIFEERR